MPDEEHRDARGIDAAGALERAAAGDDRLSGIGAGGQVQEVDLAVQAGVDDLSEAFLGLLGGGDVHDLLEIVRPLDDEGLAGPAAAGPRSGPAAFSNGAAGVVPDDL